MVQLDSGHWIGTCKTCGEESDIHWSKPRARALWNLDAPVRAAKRIRNLVAHVETLQAMRALP